MRLLALALAASLGSAGASPPSTPPAWRATFPGAGSAELPAALRATQAELAETRSARQNAGLRYLEGRLLVANGDRDGARRAFLLALSEDPILAPWTNVELAELSLQAGDSAGAARQLLAVIRTAADRSLRERAQSVLRQATENGAGCRGLATAPPLATDRREARQLELLASDCELAAGGLVRAGQRWVALLRERNDDRVAQEIVDRLGRRTDAGQTAPSLPDDVTGLAFARQREFARAIPLLERALAVAPSPDRRDELTLMLARSQFWNGEFSAAARELESLASRTAAARRAEALFYAARARELGLDAPGALADYRASESAAPRGGWAEASRLAIVRLTCSQPDRREALAAVSRFSPSSDGANARRRALLFLAMDDLVAGRTDRAQAWLQRASGDHATEREMSYWLGRLAELQRRPADAVEAYRVAIGARGFHPFAQAAAVRLAAPELRPSLLDALARLGGSRELRDRLAAASLRTAAGLADPDAEASLLRELASDSRYARFLGVQSAAASELAGAAGRTADPLSLLLQRGFWREGAAAAERHYSARPEWAVGAARELAQAGSLRASLALAEAATSRAPAGLPERFWPTSARDALVPPAFRELMLDVARQQGVDPALLAAILREESRFDPRAFSPATARGLAQFVLPTARALATALGIRDFTAADLDRPEIAIPLAARHLADLLTRYGGRPEVAVAAYNAGEAQADSWLRSCRSGDAAEYLSRVSFRETRAYLARVLESAGRYRQRADWQAGPKP